MSRRSEGETTPGGSNLLYDDCTLIDSFEHDNNDTTSFEKLRRSIPGFHRPDLEAEDLLQRIRREHREKAYQ